MDNNDIIRVLKRVPEFKLRLIDLAWRVVREDGSIDPEKLLAHEKELEEYTAEAEAYAQYTQEAVRCLRSLVRS